MMKNNFPWFYYVGRWLMVCLLRLLTRWEVRGRENVPVAGPVLIVANHLHNADPPLIAVSIHRKTVFMAKDELFRNRLIAYFIRGFGSFQIRRGKTDISAIRTAGEILDAGRGLVMFPEGSRSRSGSMNKGLPGSSLIALYNDVLILPVGITGTENIRGFSWMWKRPHVTVTIGRPFKLPHTGKVTKDQLETSTDEIMYRIAALLPAAYRGYYAEKIRQREYQEIKS